MSSSQRPVPAQSCRVNEVNSFCLVQTNHFAAPLVYRVDRKQSCKRWYDEILMFTTSRSSSDRETTCFNPFVVQPVSQNRTLIDNNICTLRTEKPTEYTNIFSSQTLLLLTTLTPPCNQHPGYPTKHMPAHVSRYLRRPRKPFNESRSMYDTLPFPWASEASQVGDLNYVACRSLLFSSWVRLRLEGTKRSKFKYVELIDVYYGYCDATGCDHYTRIMSNCEVRSWPV